MATIRKAVKNAVPRDAENPIAFLVERGWTLPQLAAAWSLKTDNTVYRLLHLRHVPSYRTAALMAKTFGWGSAGEVMDFYVAKVKAA